jgi:hypothetical protein
MPPKLSHHEHSFCYSLTASTTRSVSTQISLAVAFAKALYLASVLDHDTVCFLALHDIEFGPRNMAKPLVERLSSRHPAIKHVLQGGAARRCCGRIESSRATHDAGEGIFATGHRLVLLFFSLLFFCSYALGRDKVRDNVFKVKVLKDELLISLMIEGYIYQRTGANKGGLQGCVPLE